MIDNPQIGLIVSLVLFPIIIFFGLKLKYNNDTFVYNTFTRRNRIGRDLVPKKIRTKKLLFNSILLGITLLGFAVIGWLTYETIQQIKQKQEKENSAKK